MTCRDFSEALALRVDDETSGGAALDAHLAACAACANTLEEHRRIAQLVRATRATAPAGLAARLAARALDAESEKVVFWRDLEVFARRALRVAAAVLVAATLAAAIETGRAPASDATARAELSIDEVATIALAPDVETAVTSEESR
jgi:hypothetical protein